jgi:hypothetical protein
MCNFTGILCIVNHGTSRSIFLIANFVVLFQKYSCEEKYFSRCHVLCYPPNWYKERSINENPRSILLFALTEYFAKGKYFLLFLILLEFSLIDRSLCTLVYVGGGGNMGHEITKSTFLSQNIPSKRIGEYFSRSILLFALALFIYLHFYYFAKGKYFSRFHTFWFTQNYSNENHDLG